MDAGKAIENFEKKVVDAVNASGLHPAVVRLVLLTIVHVVQDKEREMASREEAQTDADHG